MAIAWPASFRHATRANPPTHQHHTLTTRSPELHLEGDFKKTKLKLTWLAQSDDCPALELQARTWENGGRSAVVAGGGGWQAPTCLTSGHLPPPKQCQGHLVTKAKKLRGLLSLY